MGDSLPDSLLLKLNPARVNHQLQVLAGICQPLVEILTPYLDQNK